MSQLNDCRFDALRAQGFTGATNDMLLAWAQAGGATSGHINDALLEYLQLNGATSGSLTDAWFEALRAAGYEGARKDMETAFWCEGGGSFSLKAIEGWTDGAECVVGDISIRFSKLAIFTELTIPNGVTITHDQGGIFNITSVIGSGASIVAYVGSWNIEIGIGDVILWDYDGTGDYEDEDGDQMVAHSIELFNCKNIPPINSWLVDDGEGAWKTEQSGFWGLEN